MVNAKGAMTIEECQIHVDRSKGLVPFVRCQHGANAYQSWVAMWTWNSARDGRPVGAIEIVRVHDALTPRGGIVEREIVQDANEANRVFAAYVGNLCAR